MYDEDKDETVSKADIFKQLMAQRVGQRVQPSNITRAIELVYMERGDMMDVTKFSELVGKVPYIIFPAVRLQQTMREKFGGYSLWGQVQRGLNLRMDLDRLERQREIFLKHKDAKREIELASKKKQFVERR